jgi:hypothetical protein
VESKGNERQRPQRGKKGKGKRGKKDGSSSRGGSDYDAVTKGTYVCVELNTRKGSSVADRLNERNCSIVKIYGKDAAPNESIFLTPISVVDGFYTFLLLSVPKEYARAAIVEALSRKHLPKMIWEYLYVPGTKDYLVGLGLPSVRPREEIGFRTEFDSFFDSI